MADLHTAEAIRELRARGCTMPGVAELIVEHHGALHVLSNLDRAAQLGEEVAASPDTETGAKMRALFDQAAAEAAAKAAAAVPAQLAPELSAEEKEALAYLVETCGQTEADAKGILQQVGIEKVLQEKQANESSSKSTGSPSVPVAGVGSETGSASNAAAGTSGLEAAAGSSVPSS